MLQQDRCDTLMKSFVQFVREPLTLIPQGVGISVWRPLQAQTNLLILWCLASLWLYRMTLRMKKMMRAAKRLWSMRLKWFQKGKSKGKGGAGERALHSQLEPGVAAILEGKKLLLLERIAASLNWPDMAIFQEIRDGFKLVGLQPPSGIFSIEPRPSAFSAAELDDAGKFLRPAILGRLKGLANDEDQTALWDITLQESNNKEWMDGPLSLPEVEARLIL
ncbi:unnamed protein product [Effrenium voratum]|nr:unnamed protein product [Effrenium voratum]